MVTTTPSTISKNILGLCSELVQTPEPIYLEVEAIQGAPLRECFTIVDEQIQNHGGSCCYGWQIWEWPLVMIEAEFHAVWRNGNGVLHELTPKQIKVDRILFLPEPVKSYIGKQVSS